VSVFNDVSDVNHCCWVSTDDWKYAFYSFPHITKRDFLRFLPRSRNGMRS